MKNALSSRAVIEVCGPDAPDFLQSLVTNDVTALEPGGAQWAGLLTPQGKILFDFFIWRESGQAFLLDVSAAARDGLIQRLNMYKLRRDVRITAMPSLAVAAGDAEGAVAAFADPRFDEMGNRAFIPQENAASLSRDETDYHARRIALGLPDSELDIGSGKLFPHEADFDCLNGVSFTKGCYVGQEVVSRMRHRATVKKRLLPIRGEAPLETGAQITAAGKAAGEVFSIAGGRAIALVRLDRAQAAHEAGEPLLAGDTPIRLVRPEWADFDVPGREGM